MSEVNRIILSVFKSITAFVLLTMSGICLVNKSSEYYIRNDYSFKLVGNDEITIL